MGTVSEDKKTSYERLSWSRSAFADLGLRFPRTLWKLEARDVVSVERRGGL